MVKNVSLVSALLVCLLMIVPHAAEAQPLVTVSAGTTFATLGGADAKLPFGEAAGDEVDLGNETGLFFGASLRVPLGESLSINPGLYLAQKGTSFDRDSGFQTGSVELSYIEIPVTIGVVVTGADRPFGVSLFAGSEVSFEIDCTLDTDPGFSILLHYAQFDDCHEHSGVEERERTSTLFGLVFGAEVSFGSVFLTGGLDVGLTSLDDSDANEEFKNSAWSLGVGLLVGR